jgi:Protein of unknown function (DUF4058)
MPSVRSVKNQYRGLNAHLHSYWQAKSGWNEFHTNHIADLTRLMRADLYPLGYTARTEQSVQIRRLGDASLNARANVLIFDDNALYVHRLAHTKTSNTQELIAPIPEALGLSDEEIDYHKSVAIFRLDTTPEDRGEPVAWVELLSPSNKPGGQDWRDYRRKRENLLQGGIIFIELDYLHESSPTLDMVADYRTRGSKHPPEAGSHPFRIAVIDPHPEFSQGQARVRQFDVDEPLPVVDIPLNDGAVLSFDFGAAYHKTFHEMLYGNEVDYSQLPLHFDRYSETDQIRIINRMLAVLNAARDGRDLAVDSPLPVEPVSLEEGLSILAAFNEV